MRAAVVGRWAAAGVLLFVVSRVSAAQRTPAELARCDSVVGAARVDTIAAGLFVSVARADAGAFPVSRSELIASTVGASFVAPTPFRLSVFSGPPRMRALRAVAGDTAPALRAPTVTGAYRVSGTRDSALSSVKVLRASLMPGFDSAAVTAIRIAASLTRPMTRPFMPPDGDDSMRVDVRFSTDSVRGARRIVSAFFPRLPVVDAVPKRDNPPAPFPEDEAQDSVPSGEVVLRFVVDQNGEPAMETVEVVRATSWSFLKSALNALPEQLFEPATVRGCAVAQTVDYPFSFVLPLTRPGASARFPASAPLPKL